MQPVWTEVLKKQARRHKYQSDTWLFSFYVIGLPVRQRFAMALNQYKYSIKKTECIFNISGFPFAPEEGIPRETIVFLVLNCYYERKERLWQNFLPDWNLM